jgi:hypothetical protein
VRSGNKKKPRSQGDHVWLVTSFSQLEELRAADMVRQQSRHFHYIQHFSLLLPLDLIYKSRLLKAIIVERRVFPSCTYSNVHHHISRSIVEDMAVFSDLPIELIRLIASYTSYDSINALSCVNRRWWLACQDWTILKGLIRHTHFEAFSYVLRMPCANASTWKRFALAGSKPATASVDTSDFLLWAPQLLALHREQALGCAV